MKISNTIFLTTILSMTSLLACSQTKTIRNLKAADFQSGKAFANTSTSKTVGKWSDVSKSVELNIQSGKKRIKTAVIDVLSDAIRITFTRLIIDGKDVAKEIVESIELLSMGNKSPFGGTMLDPITKNTINVEALYSEDGKFTFRFTQPMIRPEGDNDRGQKLPSKVIMEKQ
ncbi:hypothetical protein [Pedobacter sp. SYP-B3415]|uniref:hypothetical protein n=1 Tax=Pedobacter sp. SYP-B3415 TaxID=2496641 RepID=UPI00101BF244|nr:hypothetical protein [Pedobacter sp. SYP-B3415]